MPGGRTLAGPLFAASGGVLLLYSAIRGKSWTSGLRDIISGQSPVSATDRPITGTSGGGGGSVPPVTGTPPPPPDLTGTESANRALGRFLAARYGWATGQDWTALDYGWGTLESGWNNNAQNGTWPGAFGIAQANPGSKYPRSGWPVSQGGSAAATTQILWGLAYIKGKYGSPSNVPGWLGGPYSGY